MKILVDKIPTYPVDCLFAVYEPTQQYRCKLRNEECHLMTSSTGCPYLMSCSNIKEDEFDIRRQSTPYLVSLLKSPSISPRYADEIKEELRARCYEVD